MTDDTTRRLCCMGCGDSVPESEAKMRPANGAPRCPGCAKDDYPDYQRDDERCDECDAEGDLEARHESDHRIGRTFSCPTDDCEMLVWWVEDAGRQSTLPTS